MRLPYAMFTEDDLKELIAEVKAYCDSPPYFDMSAHYDGGWYSHPDLRTLKQKVPPRTMDWIHLMGRHRGVGFDMSLYFTSPSYYGRDLRIRGGTEAERKAVADKFVGFFKLRSRGRGAAALASFLTLAAGAYALVLIAGVIASRVLTLLGAPEDVRGLPTTLAAWGAPIAGLLSMAFISSWITPHVLMEGYGRFHARRRLLRGLLGAVAVTCLGLFFEWLIRGT